MQFTCRREIHKCLPHGDGVIVRVRWYAVGEDGKDIVIPRLHTYRGEEEVEVQVKAEKEGKTVEATVKEKRPKDMSTTLLDPVFCDVERKVLLPWKGDDTHASYVLRAIQELDLDSEVVAKIEKIMLHNGILKPKFDQIPELKEPIRL